jgi:hypothetical protein
VKDDRVVRVYTVSLPGGTTPSPATETSVKFEMPYRDSDHLRFVVRDDASGPIGSSEINLNPTKYKLTAAKLVIVTYLRSASFRPV